MWCGPSCAIEFAKPRPRTSTRMRYAPPPPIECWASPGGSMTTLVHPPHAAAIASSLSQRVNTLTNVAHKFGGTSMADATRIRHVAELVRARPEATQIVVVSAMSGVTDALLALAA